MTERVRTVRSGIVGLDLALGGGPRFVRRTHAEDRESATIVVRGGPGAGKSVFTQDLALRLADALGGDVLYACIEILPSETLAQRQGFADFDETRAIDLSKAGTRPKDGTGPCLVIGMRDLPIEDKVPDLGQALLDLYRIAAARDFVPKVVVVDSLSDGYQLGSQSSRELVDGVCKLAIEQGWALILIEEANAEPANSPWCFAVDTVLSLRLNERDGLAQRELIVAKHRFAACEPGPHRLLFERERIRVIPPLSAYRNASRVLELPPPAKNRSLRIPVKGNDPNWTKFDVPDGRGRCVVFEADTALLDSSNEPLNGLTIKIGAQAVDGTAQSGGSLYFLFDEQTEKSSARSQSLYLKSTLHQLIDGAEWIEDTLTTLLSWRGEVAKVCIGPTERLEVYKVQDSLRAAISMFARLLQTRGLVVVLFGRYTSSNSPRDVIQGGFISDLWVFSKDDRTLTNSEARIAVHFYGANAEKLTLTPVV